MADPYSVNPLADAVRESEPHRYEQVAAVKEPPKLFAGGTSDTPAFTASGIAPDQLLRLPVGLRHAAAAEPDINVVYSWFETYAGIPDAVIDHPGLQEARDRIDDWLENTDLDTRTPEQRAADDEAEYAAMFPIDGDRVSYATEQRRRVAAGEEPLEPFGDLERRRSLREAGW